jgi:predicted DNA-binding transcriptional regulator YafY
MHTSIITSGNFRHSLKNLIVKRVNRLLAILAVLQSQKLVTADQLAQQLGVSTRTIYRDIQALEQLQLSVRYQMSKGYIQVAVQFRSHRLMLAVLPAAVKHDRT